MRRLCVLVLTVFGFGLFGAGVPSAQEIKGPIKIVVPYPAGGGSDVVARLIADKLKDSLGQTVIVENKPGAGGRIGTEYVKGQPADGTTMLVVNPALFVVAPRRFLETGLRSGRRLRAGIAHLHLPVLRIGAADLSD